VPLGDGVPVAVALLVGVQLADRDEETLEVAMTLGVPLALAPCVSDVVGVPESDALSEIVLLGVIEGVPVFDRVPEGVGTAV